eukprot:scaffold79891_cov32-Tisochrysis_lutea.AAC.2
MHTPCWCAQHKLRRQAHVAEERRKFCRWFDTSKPFRELLMVCDEGRSAQTENFSQRFVAVVLTLPGLLRTE